MQIAMFVSYFPTLSHTFVFNQITGLLDRGHQVTIYTNQINHTAKIHPEVEQYRLLDRTHSAEMPNGKGRRVLKAVRLIMQHGYKNPGAVLRSLNVWRYGKQASSLRLLYMTLLLLQTRQTYDIVHCHFGQTGLQAVMLRELGVLRGKIVTVFHGNDITTYLRQEGDHAYDLLFQQGDLFQPISDRWRRKLIELGCRRNIQVHRMGIDCDRFIYKSRHPKPNQPIQLVTIARLVEKKGVEYGIRAVAKLLADRSLAQDSARSLDLKYTIVGDGPLLPSLQQLVKALGMTEIITLVGWKNQTEVLEILDRSQILLAPSVTAADGDQEGIPVALMEAMAMGLPIVSTVHSGIPELIKPGISGLLAPERDVVALAQQLRDLIDHPERWRSLSAAARQFVEAHYNIHSLNDRLLLTYKRLLAPVPCAPPGKLCKTN